MSQAATANAEARAPRPRRRVWRAVGLFVLGLLLCALLYAGFKYKQWSAKPDYWRANTQMLADIPIERKRERASTFMGWFSNEWFAFGDGLTTQDLIETPEAALGDTRTIVIPYEDLNILLEVEMPAILESQGTPLPDSVKGIMVTSDGNGRLIVAFEYDTPKLHQVFSMTLDVRATERGIITSTLVSARGGELTLPRAQALERIGQIIGGDRAWGEIKLMKLFTGQPFGPMDVPIDPIDDGIRNGRITGIEVHDDAIHLTRTTVARQGQGASPAPTPRIEIDE